MDTINLNAEVLRQLSYLNDDENSMRKVVKYLKKLVSQKETTQTASTVAEEAVEYRPRTKAEIMEGLDEACKEVKLYKEGKLKLRSLEEVLNEL